MNIVDELTEHHGVLRQLFERSKTDPNVFGEFIQNLTVHHTMEEKYFYDILETDPQGRHDALEAVNEHHIIELIIKDDQANLTSYLSSSMPKLLGAFLANQ